MLAIAIAGGLPAPSVAEPASAGRGIEAFVAGGEAAAAALAGSSDPQAATPGAVRWSLLPDAGTEVHDAASALVPVDVPSMPTASTLVAAGRTQSGSPGWRDSTPDLRAPQDRNRLLNTSARVSFGATELLVSRQVLDLNYPRPSDVRVNRADVAYLGRANDARMTAMAYEAALVAGRPSPTLRYYGGYVAGAKTLAAPRSASMAELFGRPGGGGMWLGGLQWSPTQGLWLQSFYHQVNGSLAIGYVDADYVRRLSRDGYARLGVQHSSQQFAGEEPTGYGFSTSNGGAYGEVGWRGLSTYAAWSSTGAGGDLRRPLSAGPVYTVMSARDFVRAGENAWLVGAAFDLARIADVRGLSVDFALADGRGALDPGTRIALPDAREYDATVGYAFAKDTRLAGVRLQARFVRVEEQSAAGRSDAVRINLALPVGFL